jgi:hypothetical protein
VSRILLVVEGEGEVSAAPILARRVLGELYGIYEWDFEVQRRKDIEHLRARGWEHFKRYLAAAFHEKLPILWMLDCDDGCAIEHLKELYEQARAVGVRQPLAFCFWVREYETMFLYDSEGVGRKLEIDQLSVPNPPESKRSAKEHIDAQMPADRSYSPRIEQPALTAILSLQKVRERYRSFQHFENALNWLIQQSDPGLYPMRSKS